MKEISASDEWCAEAYMETDYSLLSKADFEQVVRNYALFCLLGEEVLDDKINELFDPKYSHSLELNRLELSSSSNAINFVGRAARNNGVTAKVTPIPKIFPAPAGTISFALGGQGGPGVAFLQPKPYYCGRDVMILSAKSQDMSESEKLWWVTCITANRFRFGFGRQANKSLKKLELPTPDEIPS